MANPWTGVLLSVVPKCGATSRILSGCLRLRAPVSGRLMAPGGGTWYSYVMAGSIQVESRGTEF